MQAHSGKSKPYYSATRAHNASAHLDAQKDIDFIVACSQSLMLQK